MYFEATGHLDTAIEHYQEALVDKPSDEMMHKRLVAVEKTRGNALVRFEASGGGLNCSCLRGLIRVCWGAAVSKAVPEAWSC